MFSPLVAHGKTMTLAQSQRYVSENALEVDQ